MPLKQKAMITKKHINIFYMTVIIINMSACNINDKITSMEITDPERHYYAISRGQILDMKYPIKNTGKYPLFISEIQTSCGCAVVDQSSFKILPAGREGFIRIKYDSNKNIGYVKHYITIYANIESEKKEATFDINVVPNNLYTRDYEELYNEHKDKNGMVNNYHEYNLGYYVENYPY